MEFKFVRKYHGIRVKQRDDSDIEFIMFAAPAQEVVAWCHADDIRLDVGNVQRELIESRWKQVAKFVRASANNIIPTSVTVAFDGEAVTKVDAAALTENSRNYSLTDVGDGADRFVEICFSDHVRGSAFIIDGQHRLKGLSQANQPILVPVCLFPSLSRLERAFQFVTINNKSHKVPTDNLKALIRNFENIEEGLRQRLSEASITARGFATHVDVMNEDSDGPFYKLVDWVNNRHADAVKIIVPAAIENAVKSIRTGFDETKEDGADIIVLSSIWRAIFGHYAIDRTNVGEYINLTKKAVIQRVTEMVVEHLVKLLDPAFANGAITRNNAQDAAEQAKRLVTGIPAEFWKEVWELKGLDTGAGRNIIAQSIRQLKHDVLTHEDEPDFNWRLTNPLFKVSTVQVSDENSP